jgi:hypothetical protein
MLELRCKVEADIRKFLLRKGERVACIGKEDVAPVLVNGHVGVLTTLEVGKLLSIVTLNPASLVYRY